MFQLLLQENQLTMNLFFLFSAKILFFYVLFYAALAAFFGALLTVFWQTLDDEKPKWQLADGIIGANPGRNMPNSEPIIRS